MWGRLPDVLCHYTSLEAFKDIVKTKKFWATSIRYFEKDPTEFKYAIDFTLASMGEFRKDYPSDDQAFLSEFEHELNWIKQNLEKHELYIFVCSFTGLENQPDQYYEHCPDGNGYCICFDVQKLYSVAVQYGAKFGPCLYDEDEQRREIQKALREGVNEYFHRELKSALSKNQDTQTSARIAANYFILIFITKFVPFLKKGKFEKEQEWRFSYSPEVYGPGPLEGRGLRTRRGNIKPEIPYVEISLQGYWGRYGQFPFTKVYIGPTLDVDGAVKYAEEFLRKHGVYDCKVAKSGIPL